ncbi:hypothetical protein K2Q16_03995 [Patescibacteria group bacterium]|nr:hypothetical protein [Patescibacteria group bacterium]
MTATKITWFTALVCTLLTLITLPVAHASEVTGTLSSDNAQATTSENIGGTVSSDSRDGGGNNSRQTGTGGSGSNAPQGSVLGAASESSQTPGFPNAGELPAFTPDYKTFWSAIVNFIKNLTSS